MVIVLFHVLYLLGKYIYENYHGKCEKLVTGRMEKRKGARCFSDEIYAFRDPEAPQDYEVKSNLKFSPPAYVQRYNAVCKVLEDERYKGKLKKVIDFGCAEFGFFMYLKSIEFIEEIICVDIDRFTLEANKAKVAPFIVDYIHYRTKPLSVLIYEGNVTHADRKFEGADAVICIELIEHLHSDTLIDLPFNIFGFIQPKVVIITTPNADFNVLFPNFSGFRHHDHKFEWTRQQFQDWANNIILRYPKYHVTFHGICNGPTGTEHLGASTQMAVFNRYNEERSEQLLGVEGLVKLVDSYEYPYEIDNRSDEQKILDEAMYHIRRLRFKTEFEEEIPLENLLSFLNKFHIKIEVLRQILEEAGWVILDNESGPVVSVPPLSTFDSLEENDLNNDEWTEGRESLGSSTENATTFGEQWDEEAGPPTECYNNYSSQYTTIPKEDDWIEETELPRNSVEHFTAFEDQWDEEAGPPIEYYNNYSSQYTAIPEAWNEEPSIIIPHNNSIEQNHSYLLDDIHDYLNGTQSHIYQESNEVLLSNDAKRFYCQTDLQNDKLNEEHELPSSSIAIVLNTIDPSFVSLEVSSNSRAGDLRQSSPFDSAVSSETATNVHSDENITTKPIKGICRMLNFDPRLNISCSSTSPNLLAIHSDQSNNRFHEDNILENEMSYESSMLNNTFYCASELSTEEDDATVVTDSISNNIAIMSSNNQANISSRNQETSNVEYECDNSENDSVDIQGEKQSTSIKQLDSEKRLSSLSLNLESEPKYTSSPRMSVKTSKAQEESNITQNSMKYNEDSSVSSVSNVTEIRSPNVSNTPEKQSFYKTKLIILKSNPEMDNSSTDISTNFSEPTYKEYMFIPNMSSNEMETSESSALATISENSQISSISLKDMDEKNFDDKEKLLPKESDEIMIHYPIEKLNLKLADSVNESKEHLFSSNKDFTVNTTSVCLNTTDSLYSDNKFSKSFRTSLNINISESSNYNFNVSNKEHSDLKCIEQQNIEKQTECMSSVRFTTENKDYLQNFTLKDTNIGSEGILESEKNMEIKPMTSPASLETPSNSWSPEIMDSGYPNSASAQDMTSEYDLSSIRQDQIPDSESPSVAEAPRLGNLEAVQVENGDLANNNRDGEGNNMMGMGDNDLEDLQPLLDVLEIDMENENDIYVVGNGFPVWLLRMLEMAQEGHGLRAAGGDADYLGVENDEDFDGNSSEENSDQIPHEILDNDNDSLNNNQLDAGHLEDENDNDAEDNFDSNSESGEWVTDAT